MKAIVLAVVVCAAMRGQTFSGVCRVTTPQGKVKEAKFAIHQSQIEPILTFRVPVAASRPNLANDAFYRYAVQVNYFGVTSFQLSDVTPSGFDDESRELLPTVKEGINPYRIRYPTPLDKFNANKTETPLSLIGSTEEFQLTCSGKLR